MRLRGQNSLVLDTIPENAKRILWINITAPSLGDTLMDTSGRVLLGDRLVMLISHPKNAELFRADAFFNRVLCSTRGDIRVAKQIRFDLIVLDSFSPRSLKLKTQIAPTTPFVGLYGFLNAYEVHRTIYSYRRLEYLLDRPPTTVPSLSVKPIGSQGRILRTPPRIAIAVGGEWAFRTYQHWSAVIEGLAQMGHSVLLLGSENGRTSAGALVQQFGDSISSMVGETTLESVSENLLQCDLFLGADGGLWHLAATQGLPSVALHADCQLYDDSGQWHSRAAIEPLCIPLRAGRDVNEIKPETVIAAVRTLTSRLKN